MPLKLCHRCQLSKPRETFLAIPGDAGKGKVCAECSDLMQKMRKSEESEDIERAVYDGMQDLRTKKGGS